MIHASKVIKKLREEQPEIFADFHKKETKIDLNKVDSMTPLSEIKKMTEVIRIKRLTAPGLSDLELKNLMRRLGK